MLSINGLTGQGAVVALLFRMTAPTLAAMQVDLDASRGGDVPENMIAGELAELVRRAGVNLCGGEDWAVELRAAREAADEVAALLAEIDANDGAGIAGVLNAM